MRSTLLAALLFTLPATASAQAVHQVAHSSDGVVATANPLATFAAQRVLEDGGNAADAAVAAAFAIAVVLPSMNSIGGRNQILVRSVDGDVSAIDGTTQIPRAYDPETAVPARSGYTTVGIPGVVAGLMKLHGEYGTRPLPELMAFAIGYAADGFRLMPQEEWFHEMAAADLGLSAGMSQYFLHPDGSQYRAGDLLVQEDLAATLRTIASDAGESFYRGDIAARIAEDMVDNGGYVAAEDLAEYEAMDARVVRGSYRGYELVGAGIPAAGAVSIQALQILETFERADYSPAVWAAMAGQAIGFASRELGGLGTDSAAVRATSKAWAATQAERVVTGTSTAQVPSSGADTPAVIDHDAEGQPQWQSQHYTTHVSVVDRDGMAVSLTQTVGPVMGSRVATPGLGFHYAVTLGGYLGDAGPGTRARSFISPLLVLKDGEPVMVIGAAGGARIVASVVQVISRVIDDQLSLTDALVAPRVFMGFGSGLEMETSGPNGWTEAQMSEVRALDLDVTAVDGPVAFALVQALLRDSESRVWEAGSEPDGEGAAAGVIRR